MNAAVEVKDLTVGYGSNVVLKDLQLSVGRGEFLVLLGSSGCGKSTLLNVIAGLNELSDGEVWISGRNVTWEEPSGRGIGMVFQSYALYPRMTVRQNLSFALEAARLPRKEIDERVSRASSLLQIDGFLDRKPAQLSGGQRQRVAIGRALVRNVDVFLFDEPLSNLDAKLRSELRVELKKLHQTLGNTMIYVTHDQVEALTLADRVAVMRGGRIEQLDTPENIYHRPANLYVAGFVGSPPMNLIDGTIHISAHGPVFQTGDISIPLLDLVFTTSEATGPVKLGFRPEAVEIANETDGALSGTVSLVEPTGPETIVWVDFVGHSVALRAPGRTGITIGNHITFDLKAAEISLFTRDGSRILRPA